MLRRNPPGISPTNANHRHSSSTSYSGNTYAAGSSDSAGSTRGGCYIATAVYGSYDAPEVLTLRRFRDETLAASAVGRAFIRAYYRVSPGLASRLRSMPRLNALARSWLDRFTAFLDDRHVR
jgi:hypothetical protein